MKRKELLLLILLVSSVTGMFNLRHRQTLQNFETLAYHQTATNITPKDFYQKQCGFCHASEELIAPDMTKIKKVYKEKYPKKADFVNAVVKFVKNPSKKFAIYKLGIDNFTDMPKMPFKEADIKGVAGYIFDHNDL